MRVIADIWGARGKKGVLGLRSLLWRSRCPRSKERQDSERPRWRSPFLWAASIFFMYICIYISSARYKGRSIARPIQQYQ